MKHIYTFFLSAIGVLLCVTSANAQVELPNGLVFLLKRSTATAELTDSPKASGNISIPDVITTDKKYTVKKIGDGAFFNNKNITSVTIPYSVKSIGTSAFSGCSKLTSITCETPTMEHIGSDPFYETPWFNNQTDPLVYFGNWIIKINTPQTLDVVNIRKNTKRCAPNIDGTINARKIYIPDQYTTIGEEMLSPNTEKFVVMSNNPKYCSDSYGAIYLKNNTVSSGPYRVDNGDTVFSVTGKTLFRVPRGNKNPFNVAPGTVALGRMSCYNTSFNKIVIPESVQIICNEAFFHYDTSDFGCKIIDMPANLKALERAFNISSEYTGAVILRVTEYPYPYTNNTTIFEKFKQATLYVPRTRINLMKDGFYQTFGSKFKQIRAIEDGEPSLYEAGDVNQDGAINSADVVAVYNYIVQGNASGISKDDADVNTDNAVNSSDATYIYNKILGN